MTTTAVICAHNEADRIGAVLDAVSNAYVGNIIVVVDRSDDATADVAATYADLVVPITSATKGTAMTIGATHATGETVLFLDADITGITPVQVTYLATAPPKDGMLVGVRGKVNGGRIPTILGAWPSISGERRIPRVFVKSLHLAGRGWWSETIIDAAVARARMPHRQVILEGVANTRSKSFSGWAAELVRVTAATVAYGPTLARYSWTLEP